MTASATGERDAFACAQQTALFPCGGGPGVETRQRGAFATVSENATRCNVALRLLLQLPAGSRHDVALAAAAGSRYGNLGSGPSA